MPRTRTAPTPEQHAEATGSAALADLSVLAESFRRSLWARNRSHRTVHGYLAAVTPSLTT